MINKEFWSIVKSYHCETYSAPNDNGSIANITDKYKNIFMDFGRRNTENNYLFKAKFYHCLIDVVLHNSSATRRDEIMFYNNMWNDVHKLPDGDNDKSFFIAITYQYGLGVDADMEKAYKYYMSSVNATIYTYKYRLLNLDLGLNDDDGYRNSLAYCHMGAMIICDYVSEKSLDVAMRFLERSSDLGNMRATYIFAQCHLLGHYNDYNSVFKIYTSPLLKSAPNDFYNPDRAKQILLKNCRGDWKCSDSMNLYAVLSCNTEEKISYFTKAVSLGNNYAMYNIFLLVDKNNNNMFQKFRYLNHLNKLVTNNKIKSEFETIIQSYTRFFDNKTCVGNI